MPLTLFHSSNTCLAVLAGKFLCTELNLLEIKAAVKVHLLVNAMPFFTFTETKGFGYILQH